MIASVVQVQWVARMKNEGLEAQLSLSLGPLIRTPYKQQDWTKKVLKAKYAAYFRSSVCQESQALIPNWSVSLKTFDSGQVNYFFSATNRVREIL